MLRIPRLIISGLSGGAGKTVISLGIARGLSRSGLAVRALKKGPDYIDAAWLALAAGSGQANLDPFFSPGESLLALFAAETAGSDLALIEGNRGLFDGLDLSGSCSTAEVSRILAAPVVLIIDCTKMTRTAAALVRGCLDFEKNVHIGGVILNRTGNDRHRTLVRQAVETHTGLPVIGMLPRRAEPFIVERHMGLSGMDEYKRADGLLDDLADFVSMHVDLAKLRALAESAPPLGESASLTSDLSVTAQDSPGPELFSFLPPSRSEDQPESAPDSVHSTRPQIGYVRDAAFWFYYRENLKSLAAAGAELFALSLLDERPWPDLDGLYIGGGLPELYARQLAANAPKRNLVAALAQQGLPIYAECGGFMYLSRNIRVAGEVFPMAGVFPCSVELHARPQGLGYVEAEVIQDNPYHPVGTRFRGHEFHFSRCLFAYANGTPGTAKQSSPKHALLLHKGRGMTRTAEGLCLDGLLYKNTFAAYTHIYAPALPHWAANFVRTCRASKG